MITRYNANFQDHMMETDPEGRFVKYADHAQTELLVDIKVEEQVAEKIKEQLAALQLYQDEHKVLSDSNSTLGTQLRELRDHTSATISRQNALILAAKDRLNLHGHTATCDSRYKMTSSDGNTINGECNCGLEAWMIESGVRNG